MKIIKYGELISSPDGTLLPCIPMPEAYAVIKSGFPVLGRISEFESPNLLFTDFLVDPLASWNVAKYKGLIESTQLNHNLYVVMPSCHGHTLEVDKAVADLCGQYDRVKALITEHPDELEIYLGTQ